MHQLISQLDQLFELFVHPLPVLQAKTETEVSSAVQSIIINFLFILERRSLAPLTNQMPQRLSAQKLAVAFYVTSQLIGKSAYLQSGQGCFERQFKLLQLEERSPVLQRYLLF